MMLRRAAFAALATLATATGCNPSPPIQTSSGMAVEGVEIQESFARSDEVHQTTFHGKRLRRAVELMDENGVFGLSGDYGAKGVLDSSTLLVLVHGADHRDTPIQLRNCAEAHVCAFMAEAVSEGVVERLPLVCRSSNRCSDVAPKGR